MYLATFPQQQVIDVLTACDVITFDASVTEPSATEMPFTYLTLEPPESFAPIRNVVKGLILPHSHILPTRTHRLVEVCVCVMFPAGWNDNKAGGSYHCCWWEETKKKKTPECLLFRSYEKDP